MNQIIKYEVNKLKGRPIPAVKAPISAIPNDLLDCLVSAANEAKKETNSLCKKQEKLNYELQCIKFEVKKLKNLPIPDNFLDRISASEKNATETQQVSNKAKKETISLRQEQEKLNYKLQTQKIKSKLFAKINFKLKADLICLKYDFNKIKETPAPQTDAPIAIPNYQILFKICS